MLNYAEVKKRFGKGVRVVVTREVMYQIQGGMTVLNEGDVVSLDAMPLGDVTFYLMNEKDVRLEGGIPDQFANKTVFWKEYMDYRIGRSEEGEQSENEFSVVSGVPNDKVLTRRKVPKQEEDVPDDTELSKREAALLKREKAVQKRETALQEGISSPIPKEIK